ncbi:MAG TPA: hypothetical protein VGQ66_00020 [Candidatus Limnocylindria bacterium]|jgi:hypothetical protein|nr:hypothetical protein [Candidatus Limnocylindria bacterium]
MAPTYRYPTYNLESALDVARRINDRGADAVLSADELAAVLGYSSKNNGAFLSRLAAARLFGFLEGQAGALTASDRAVTILQPDYPENADRARLAAFKGVPLFGAFLDAFGGRELSDDAGMKNALITRFKIPAKEAGPILARLMESAEQAGLFRVAGNRTRMIEPTIRGGTPAHTNGTGAEPPSSPPKEEPKQLVQGLPKTITGALELLPAGREWQEDEYAEWLAFFDMACRVYYKLPRTKEAG